jgi:hypothetical protein
MVGSNQCPFASEECSPGELRPEPTRVYFSKTFPETVIGEPGRRPRKGKAPISGAFMSGRYWARTSDPQLVELVLSQLS